MNALPPRIDSLAAPVERDPVSDRLHTAEVFPAWRSTPKPRCGGASFRDNGASMFGCPALGCGVAQGGQPRKWLPRKSQEGGHQGSRKGGIQKVDPPLCVWPVVGAIRP